MILPTGVALGALMAASALAPAGAEPVPRAEAAAMPPLAPARAARPFPSCEAFAGHMRGWSRRIATPYGLPTTPGGALPMPVDAIAATGPESAGAPVAEPPADAAPVAGRDHSGTNLQEAGVDEPDLVTTDGRHIYALVDGRLRVLEVTDGAPRLVAARDLSGIDARSLLLVGERLLVIGPGGPVTLEAASAPAADIMPAPAGPSRVAVREFDVGDPARPVARATFTADGDLVAARHTGTGLRLVIAGRTAPPPAATPAGGSRAELRAARAENRRALARTRASDWLPRTVLRRADGTAVRRVMTGCRAVTRPAAFSGIGMVTVLTLDTDRGLTVTDSDTVLTDAGVVYASPAALYIAAPRWVAPDAGGAGPAPRGSTTVYRFDTSRHARTEPAGGAAVPGYPLNQFAMSEHRGHLRIATTEEPGWWDAPGGGERSQSMVTVLATEGGRMERTGQVAGLGRGERIHAVRYLGDRGYVVTFRRTDPLYSLDLSDPAAPRLTGELKIPGYSAYLHPVDDTTLIGIGQDATSDGRTVGTQVSLFDVSDPAAPARIARHALGPGYSEAEDDHLAVLYWPRTGLLAIPLQTWQEPGGGGAPFTGAAGLRVDREDGIREVRRLTHGLDAPIRRAVVVGDAVYTLSAAGVGRHALDDLAPQGFTRFG